MVANACKNAFDIAVLVSGDRDFIPAIEKIKEFNKKFEVWAFKNSLSRYIRKIAAKNINYLDDILQDIIYEA